MPGLSASKWANRYHIGRDGNRDEVCDKNERDLINNPGLFSQLHELRGKKLGCWCKTKGAPDTRCHGDTYVKYLFMMYPEDQIDYLVECSETKTEQLDLF
jgi:hypothetical protein